jgi:hypothetical protein
MGALRWRVTRRSCSHLLTTVWINYRWHFISMQVVSFISVQIQWHLVRRWEVCCFGLYQPQPLAPVGRQLLAIHLAQMMQQRT